MGRRCIRWLGDSVAEKCMRAVMADMAFNNNKRNLN
jgi:hypothetical protein